MRIPTGRPPTREDGEGVSELVADLKPLRGQSIRLLMHLEKATVYGISGE